MTTVSDYSGPSPSSGSSSGELSVGEDAQLERQIMVLAGFALVALIICVILMFVFSTTISAFGPAFTAEITTIANSIEGQAIGAVNLFEQGARSATYIATDSFNKCTSAISDGVTSVVNVVLSIGNSALNTLVAGIQSTLDLLSEMSADTFIFFENIFQPLVTVITIIGQVIIDGISILTSMLSPILTIISDFIASIEAIGQSFPWG